MKELIDKLKKNLEGDIQDEKALRVELMSNLAMLLAENIVLKTADDTARSLIMSIVMDNGGSITLNKRVDHKTCGYELAVEPSEGETLILKAVKKDESVH
jgi:hypothetical protein